MITSIFCVLKMHWVFMCFKDALGFYNNNNNKNACQEIEEIKCYEINGKYYDINNSLKIICKFY